jgi:SAM-dependent methyltransferase
MVFRCKRLYLIILYKTKVLLGFMSKNESIFRSIYKLNVWGKSPYNKYFSGTGSTFEIAKPYIEFISKYIEKNNIKSVVDLGCGDYNVSRLIDLGNASYLGIDVVSDLIKFNNKIYGSHKNRFLHLDIVKDDLPSADLCLIRQVLQHLSDSDIQTVLLKLRIYKHILVMDGWDKVFDKVNNDIETGEFRQFGTYLESSPYNCKIESLLKYDSLELEISFRLIRLISVPDRYD